MFTINGNLVINGQSGTGGWDHPQVGRRDAPSSSRVRITRSASRSTTRRPARRDCSPGSSSRPPTARRTTLVTDGTWKTLENPGANWHNRALDTRDWPAAEVLGDYGMAPWGKLKFAHLILPPPSYLRTRFTIEKPVRQGDAVRHGPGDLRRALERPSRERRLVQPRLDRLHQAGLLPRLRRDQPGPRTARTPSARSSPMAGTAATSASARSGTTTARNRGSAPCCTSSWPTAAPRTSRPDPTGRPSTGPILEADFLMGETYDARKAMPGWDARRLRRQRLAPGRSRRRAEAGRPVASRPAGARLRRAQAEVDRRAEARDVRAGHGPELRRGSSGSRRPASRAGRSPCGSPSGSTPMARSTRPTSARPASRIRTSATRSGDIDWSRGSRSTGSSTSRSPAWRRGRPRRRSPASPCRATRRSSARSPAPTRC